MRQDGGQASEVGGKNVNRYVVADPRVIRIIERQLSDIVGAEIEQGDQDD